MYITRIAPSPTGMFHIGTGRTAMFNWLAARATGGKFILRIDDTDTDRNNEAVIQPIFDGLAWLGLDYDETFRQSDRTAIYKSYAELLLHNKIAMEADNGAIILKWHNWMPRLWNDTIGGEMAINDKMIEGIDGRLVLMRGHNAITPETPVDKFGQATYQFASILDDYLTDVNYIIRGTDHIANTSKQVSIWSALNHVGTNKALPKFAHVGLIFKDKKKMSKRDGAASLLDYRDNDYDPDGVFNFLLRIGWSPSIDDKASTFMSKNQAISLFLTAGQMRSSSANFDEQKLEFYNRRYKQMKYKNNIM